MTTCPNCRSERIVTLHLAKKTCGFVGMLGGITSGASGVFGGAEIGGTVGLLAGPPGAALGILTGIIMGALVGGAAGCLTGAKIGEAIDARLLDNYQCLDCHYVFGQQAE